MIVTEELLQSIKNVPKHFKPDQSMSHTTQRGSDQWSFTLELDSDTSLDETLKELSIKLFARQNILDQGNFSCGIQITQENETITLSRYNGSNHVNDVAYYECHTHHATVNSINRGDRNPEHDDTQTTDRYTDLEGAFKCLCDEYSIKLPPSDLFERRLL